MIARTLRTDEGIFAIADMKSGVAFRNRAIVSWNSRSADSPGSIARRK
jgi:hypothetical protein